MTPNTPLRLLAVAALSCTALQCSNPSPQGAAPQPTPQTTAPPEASPQPTAVPEPLRFDRKIGTEKEPFPTPTEREACAQIFALSQTAGENPFVGAKGLSDWQELLPRLETTASPTRTTIPSWDILTAQITRPDQSVSTTRCTWPHQIVRTHYALAVHGPEGTNGAWYEKTGPDAAHMDHWLVGGLHWQRRLFARDMYPYPSDADYLQMQWVLTPLTARHVQSRYGIEIIEKNVLEQVHIQNGVLAKGIQFCQEDTFSSSCSFASIANPRVISNPQIYHFLVGDIKDLSNMGGNRFNKEDKVRTYTFYSDQTPYDLTGKKVFDYTDLYPPDNRLGEANLVSIRGVLDKTLAEGKPTFVQFVLVESDGQHTLVKSRLDANGDITVLGFESILPGSPFYKAVHIFDRPPREDKI